MYQNTSASLSATNLSATNSMRMAREVFFHWVMTMPANASPALEAKKVLAKPDSPLGELPTEVQKDLRQMLRQVSENIASLPKRGRRRRMLKN